MNNNICSQCESVAIKDLIKIHDVVNKNGDNLEFLGLNKNKNFMPSVADTTNINNKKYKIVDNDVFAFSGMQTGRDNCIRIGLYKSDKPALVSPAYTTFVLKDKNTILPEYLYLNLSRLEMDRYGAFLSDSSIRSNLDWERFLNIEIPLPDIDTQRELVAIYTGLQKLISDNEALLQSLSAVCEAFVVDCKSKYSNVQLEGYIEESKITNEDNSLKLKDVRGISTGKSFIETKANMAGISLRNYKIVKAGELAYVSDTSRRGDKIALAFNSENQPILISSIYTVFRSKDENVLLPEYLFLLFNRSEFDRYSRFNSWGSARETFDFEDLCKVKIGLPPINIQRSIVKVSQCLEKAKLIVTESKVLLQNLCPALVQKAAHSA